MKQSLLCIILFGLTTIVKAQVDSNRIIGQWHNEKNTLVAEFYKNGETYAAKIVSIDSPDGEKALDINNPDPEKRNRHLKGIELISGLEYASGSWKNGKIYVPKKGVYLSCKITIKNDEMQVTVSKGLLSETKIWIRKK